MPIKFAIILSLCVLLAACSFTHTNETINNAERLVNTAPDSALYLLETLLADYNDLSDQEKAFFGILYFKSIYKVDGKYPALDFIDHSIDFYRSERNKYWLPQALFYKSMAQKQNRSYQNTSIQLFETIEYTLYISKKTLSKLQKNILLISFSSILTILAGVLLFVYFWRKWKMVQSKKEELLNQKEIQLKNKHNLMYQELLSRIRELQEAQAKERKKMTFAQKKQADIEIYKQVLVYDKEDLFLEKMNRFLNQLPDTIKHNFPNLLYKDIVWCCLFLILPAREMALIIGVQENTLRKQKQRLAEKMNFENNAEFEKYLSEAVLKVSLNANDAKNANYHKF